MKRLMVCMVLLLTSTFATSADIEVRENPVPQNSFGRASIKLDKGQAVLWDIYPEPTTMEEFVKDGQGVVFFNGPKGTKYKVQATLQSIKDGNIVSERVRKYVLIAGDPEPTPDPDPSPDPDPMPGAATLSSLLKAAFKAEDADEKTVASKLTDLYAKYANVSELSKFTTWGALETAMRTDAKDYGLAGKLVKTQTVIHNYLAGKIPFGTPGWENIVLTDKDRTQVRGYFSTISSAAGKLK